MVVESEGASKERGDAYPDPSCSLSAMSCTLVCQKMFYTVNGLLRRWVSRMIGGVGY